MTVLDAVLSVFSHQFLVLFYVSLRSLDLPSQRQKKDRQEKDLSSDLD